MKPLKCKTYLSTISLRVLESVGISETIVLQGVPVNNVLGVCVYVQESVGITVKPLKCKTYLLTMSLCVCVQESVDITLKPLKCKAYLSTMSLVCVCVCVSVYGQESVGITVKH